LLFLIAAVLLLTQENLQGRASTGKTAQSGRARTHVGSAVFPACARCCNKPHCRFQSWWTGSSLLTTVAVRFQTRRMLLQRLSRCFHQYSRCHLSQMPSPIYQLVYELPWRNWKNLCGIVKEQYISYWNCL